MNSKIYGVLNFIYSFIPSTNMQQEILGTVPYTGERVLTQRDESLAQETLITVSHMVTSVNGKKKKKSKGDIAVYKQVVNMK